MRLAPVLSIFGFVALLVPHYVLSRPQGGNDGDDGDDGDHGDDGNDDHDESPQWERSGKFEGDMDIPGVPIQPRNGMTDKRFRWPNKRIPYVFASGHFSAAQKAKIVSALRQFEASCLRVVPRTNERSYVRITRAATGCHSRIGYENIGPQPLNLQDDSKASCMSSGTIVHEFLHAAGFYHQQSAVERDNYVNIYLNNVERDKYRDFKTYNTQNFGITYDYKSVMHYSKYAFAINKRRPTIEAKGNPALELGNRVRMTAKDLAKLNRMYQCTSSG